MIHPRLTNREVYAMEITEVMLQIIEETKEKNKEQFANDNKPKATTVDNRQDIPSFHLEVKVKKWGELKTEVLTII